MRLVWVVWIKRNRRVDRVQKRGLVSGCKCRGTHHGVQNAVEDSRTKGFGQYVGKVLGGGYVDEAEYPGGDGFAALVVCDGIVFLLQHAGRDRGIQQDSVVISEQDSW
jgi:hypothetical protein